MNKLKSTFNLKNCVFEIKTSCPVLASFLCAGFDVHSLFKIGGGKNHDENFYKRSVRTFNYDGAGGATGE